MALKLPDDEMTTEKQLESSQPNKFSIDDILSGNTTNSSNINHGHNISGNNIANLPTSAILLRAAARANRIKEDAQFSLPRPPMCVRPTPVAFHPGYISPARAEGAPLTLGYLGPALGLEHQGEIAPHHPAGATFQNYTVTTAANALSNYGTWLGRPPFFTLSGKLSFFLSSSFSFFFSFFFLFTYGIRKLDLIESFYFCVFTFF